MSDNRIEDCLQRFISPSAYCIWRQYLRFWGGDKKKAYPSLAYLSRVTGLSERTIRKVNKELVKKGFMRMISGHSNKSNTYLHIEINKILKLYEKKTELIEIKEEADPPVSEIENESFIAQKFIDKLGDREATFVSMFLGIFKNEYKEYFGIEYNEDAGDVKAIIDNVKDICENDKRYIKLIEIYFKQDNYLDTSDRSIYFFFRPKTLKMLASKYLQTDMGRWDSQAEDIWTKQLKSIANNKSIEDKIKYPNEADWIKSRVKFGGANKNRDTYVLSYLVDKLFKARDSR
jgi:hypothetical protein